MTDLRQHIDQVLAEQDESVLLLDGLDEALVGFTKSANKPMVAVYSSEKAVKLFIDRDGMDYDDAIEHVERNCVNAWNGDNSPLFIIDFNELIAESEYQDLYCRPNGGKP